MGILFLLLLVFKELEMFDNVELFRSLVTGVLVWIRFLLQLAVDFTVRAWEHDPQGVMIVLVLLILVLGFCVAKKYSISRP